jgi:putative restriction endonuclease
VGLQLRAYVGVTDFEWFTYLSKLPGIDEVNFWQSGGRQHFRTLIPGEPFLFKLPCPRHYIVGGDSNIERLRDRT